MPISKSRLFFKLIILSLLLCQLMGCAKKPVSPEDPFEPFNRSMFGLGMGIDRAFVRPVAKVYHSILPPQFLAGISNAFDNLGEIRTFPNDILQGKIKFAILDVMRFVVNSTVGIGGLFDVATRAGLPKHYEDFGMTLAYYDRGNKLSSYLFLPILGPSTMLDAVGRPADIAADPLTYLHPSSTATLALAGEYIELRSRFLDADKLLDSAFDPYVAMRDAYLQKRQSMIANNHYDFDRNYPDGVAGSVTPPPDFVQ